MRSRWNERKGNSAAVRWLPSAVVLLLLAGCSAEVGVPTAAPDGAELLQRMSDALGSASSIRFHTTETLETVQPDGSKQQHHFSRQVVLRRPNELRFELEGAEGTELDVVAVYDGATLSLRGDIGEVWAQADVPAALDEMLDDVARRFALPIPVADVLYSRPSEALIGPETLGGRVGSESVDGVECHLLLYVDDWVEIRLWIPVAGPPLPHRLILVYNQVPGRPKASMTFADWNLDAPAGEEEFTFEVPEGHDRIPIEEFLAEHGSVAGLGEFGEGELR